MARPMTTHPGFLIPNAGGVANPQMSEPDQVDFNTLGNARYGVIEGCEVTVSGSSAINTAGTALVNGLLVTMAGGQSVSLGSAGTQDRYDLLTVDTNGQLKLVSGTPAQDPVYPDPPTSRTVLAAVYCATGSSTYSDNVIDKRKFLPDSLLTKIAASSSLVANRNGTGDMFRISGDGITSWAGDTTIERISAKTLQITENLNVVGDLALGDALTAATVTATGRIAGSNLQRGATPTLPGALGDIFQGTNGKIYVYTATGWLELATLPSVTPVGMVINSLQAPSVMTPLGWVALAGDSISEDAYPSLFTIPALGSFITGGTAPHRTMKLPDSRNRVLMGDSTQAATYGGSTTISVLLANMPRHGHNVALSPGGSHTPSGRTRRNGQHGHVATGGRHPHDVYEEPHRHNGMDNGINGMRGAVVGLQWGGQNKIDAYFNDRSHTYSVEAMDWTMPATTNLEVLASPSSDHGHAIEENGDHDHVVDFDAVPDHPHSLTQQDAGSGTPIEYRPAYMTVYVYVRA